MPADLADEFQPGMNRPDVERKLHDANWEFSYVEAEKRIYALKHVGKKGFALESLELRIQFDDEDRVVVAKAETVFTGP